LRPPPTSTISASSSFASSSTSPNSAPKAHRQRAYGLNSTGSVRRTPASSSTSGSSNSSPNSRYKKRQLRYTAVSSNHGSINSK
jgi:hypothetical protein